MGIIDSIIDSTGEIIVRYTYDPYGKLLEISGDEASTIGKYNHIIYKGFYYDFESEMYFKSILFLAYHVPFIVARLLLSRYNYD